MMKIDQHLEIYLHLCILKMNKNENQKQKFANTE